MCSKPSPTRKKSANGLAGAARHKGNQAGNGIPRRGARTFCKGSLDDGSVLLFDSVYHDIVENKRLVCSYNIEVGGKRISVNQTSIDLEPEGEGAKLTLIEYNQLLDGFDDAGSIKKGTGDLFDQLGEYLKRG